MTDVQLRLQKPPKEDHKAAEDKGKNNYKTLSKQRYVNNNKLNKKTTKCQPIRIPFEGFLVLSSKESKMNTDK